jgi:periplasmic protein TonB
MTRWTKLAIPIALALGVVLLAAPRLVRAGDDATAGATKAPIKIETASGDTMEFQSLDDMPKVIKRVPPRYPESARRRRQEGTVFVRALVTVKGTTDRLQVPPGKGVAPDLDRAALQAIRQWEFEPAKKDGKPVAVYIVIPVKFVLH